MADDDACDCFLSHNRQDRPAVRALAAELRAAGVSVWLDEERLRPGMPWLPGLESGIRACRSVAVLIGADGVGPWEDEEQQAALQLAVRDRRPVIPVLLPGAPLAPDLPLFLANRTWVDLRPGAHPDGETGIERLIWGITGYRADPNGQIRARPTRADELRYLDRLLTGIEAKARLYAPLRGIAQRRPASGPESLLEPWRDDEDIALLLYRPRQPRHGADPQTQTYDDILAAFGQVKQVALLGAPGAGKSTTLRRLAADLARAARADARAPLPLLASLGDWRGDESFSAFLAERCPAIGWAVSALAQTQRLVLLLDGLNEVPTARRQAKSADLLALRRRLPADTPFVVSCRRDDAVGDLDLGLDTLSLEPLSPQRIRDVLRHWLPDGTEGVAPGSAERLFWQLAGDERLASVLDAWLVAGASEESFWGVDDPQDDKTAFAKTSGEQDRLWRDHLPNPRSLLRLAANPFMLTMIYQVWAYAGELPRNRGELFARFVDRLLSREGLLVRDRGTGAWQHTPDGERLLCGLSGLAWVMQGQRLGQGTEKAGDFGVLTVVPRADALAALGGESLLKKAEDATVLEGIDEIRFRHQLLQEYFTASAMRQRIEHDGLQAASLWPPDRWWERSGWEESAVLLAGLHSDDCTSVVRWLMDAQPELAAQCVLESGAAVADESGLRQALHDAWLPRLTDLVREPEPQARATIGRTLGRLGLDDRKGLGLRLDGVPDIDWVEIPGGPFVYQDGERREVDSFRIARYPVTNARFRAFLKARNGYANDRWWVGLDDPDRNPGQPRWDISNHPREQVSWFEAMAFCAWLGHLLRLPVRLPTEWEWERAARGADGREYPWGDGYRAGYANIDETVGDAGRHFLQRTSPVAIYLQGASENGVLDLCGNIGEWCLNEFDHPERIQSGGSGPRVVRGGSWHCSRRSARAAFRSGYHPRHCLFACGFRVVCRSPIH